MLCAKFGWNLSSGSGEEDFLKFVNVFSHFQYYLSLEKGVALHLYKLESPSPKDALCQVWLKLAPTFLKRRWKCEKFTTTPTTTMTTKDNGQIMIRKAHLSLGLRWAKNRILRPNIENPTSASWHLVVFSQNFCYRREEDYLFYIKSAGSHFKLLIKYL